MESDRVSELVQEFMAKSPEALDALGERMALDVEAMMTAARDLIAMGMAHAATKNEVPEEIQAQVNSLANTIGKSMEPRAMTTNDLKVIVMSAMMFAVFVQEKMEE